MDVNKHRQKMLFVLRDIFSDEILSKNLAFKGGTAAMFQYGLNRFSTDLDFNLLNPEITDVVYERLLHISEKHGTILDTANKKFGPIVVIDYGFGERNLKVEVSRRVYCNHYETKNLFGMDMRFLTLPDMFSHKLCAFWERNAPRDTFDCMFFLSKGIGLNENIIFERTGLSVAVFLTKCAEKVSKVSSKTLMSALGELIDKKQQNYVKNQLLPDLSNALIAASAFPYVVPQSTTERERIVMNNRETIKSFLKNDIDIAMILDKDLTDILKKESFRLKNKNGFYISFRKNAKGEFITSRGLSV